MGPILQSQLRESRTSEGGTSDNLSIGLTESVNWCSAATNEIVRCPVPDGGADQRRASDFDKAMEDLARDMVTASSSLS